MISLLDGVSIQTENELRHHGILGQKWGVQNGPPYPLSSNLSAKKKKSQRKTSERLTKKTKQILEKNEDNKLTRDMLVKNIPRTVYNIVNTLGDKRIDYLVANKYDENSINNVLNDILGEYGNQSIHINNTQDSGKDISLNDLYQTVLKVFSFEITEMNETNKKIKAL